MDKSTYFDLIGKSRTKFLFRVFPRMTIAALTQIAILNNTKIATPKSSVFDEDNVYVWVEGWKQNYESKNVYLY